MSADTLPAFGFCNGCPDVSMDAHSLYVEKAWAAAGVTIVACACSPDPPSSAELTHLVALNHAFVLLTLLCVITAAAARILRTGSDRTREQAHRTREAARSSH
ncbi:hypothetical protein ACFQ10_50975 [Streptomyces indonesiensis]